jgi:ABC-type antimicrobial peptide transport system permease subunit
MLFGVEPIDVATLAAVVGVLHLTGAAAAAAPAWRVTRIDPATALRAK